MRITFYSKLLIQDTPTNGLARTYSLDQNTRGQGSRTSGRSPQGYVQQASCDSMNIKTILYRACDQREEEKRKKQKKFFENKFLANQSPT